MHGFLYSSGVVNYWCGVCDSHTPNPSSSYRQTACLLSRHGTIWTAQLASGASGYIHKTAPMVTYQQEIPHRLRLGMNQHLWSPSYIFLLLAVATYYKITWATGTEIIDTLTTLGLWHLRVYRYATCHKLHRGFNDPASYQRITRKLDDWCYCQLLQ